MTAVVHALTFDVETCGRTMPERPESCSPTNASGVTGCQRGALAAKRGAQLETAYSQHGRLHRTYKHPIRTAAFALHLQTRPKPARSGDAAVCHAEPANCASCGARGRPSIGTNACTKAYVASLKFQLCGGLCSWSPC